MKNNTKKTIIRAAEERDFDFILKTNLDNVKVLSPMNAERLQWLAGMAELFLVAEVDGKAAAFLMALREGANQYDSENYRWFSARYDSFLYVESLLLNPIGIWALERNYIKLFSTTQKNKMSVLSLAK